MLSEEKNRIMTQVSAGTPMGDYLRRYWMPIAGAAAYRIHWRRADKTDWTDSRNVAGDADAELILPGVIVDDHFFGVSALAADGSESIVTFGGLPPAQ